MDKKIKEKEMRHTFLGIAIGIGATLLVGTAFIPVEHLRAVTPKESIDFADDIKTRLLIVSDYARVSEPVWSEGEAWKADSSIKIIGVTMRVSIMPLRVNSDNTSPLTSGFSHGVAEVSLSEKPHFVTGVLLQGQVYFHVPEGLGAAAGTSNANVSIAYSQGQGVVLNKGQPLYIRMLHEVYNADPEQTICEAVAVVSYVEAE